MEKVFLCGCSYVWNMYDYIQHHTCSEKPDPLSGDNPYQNIGCTCNRVKNISSITVPSHAYHEHGYKQYPTSQLDTIKYTNMADTGTSNENMVRKIIEVVSEIGLDNFDDTVFYVGWTDFVRFEVYNNLKEKYMRMGLEKQAWSDTKHWRYHMKYYLNQSDMFRKYLEQIIFLQSFFNDNDIKYVFFDSLDNLLSSYAKKYREKYKKIFSMIDLDKWAIGDTRRLSSRAKFDGKTRYSVESWKEDKNYYSFQSYLNTIEKYVRGNKHKYWKDDGHPNSLGCKEWFKVLNRIAQ